MSQIQITGEAKIRSLNGALTATSGVVDSVPLGAANGVATLGGDGKVPSSQLPSYVDDVVEVPTYADLPVVGESGKIYITLDTNKIYRWTGSTYVEIVDSTAVWGAITGTLSNQTDLQNALDAKVPYTGATANVDLGAYGLDAKYLEVNLTPPASVNVGQIVWNPIDGTFDMGLLNGVTLQAGQELHFYGKASGTIGNGKAVMFAGVEGDHLLMSEADAATINANPQYFIGVATQDFANNDFGYVTVLGKVRSLNTTAYTLGSVLYYDSTSATDGLLTATMPTAPNAKIEVAAVVRVHATQGVLMVRPHVMPKLSQLQDVNISSIANGNILAWDTNKWQNNTIAGVLGYTPANDSLVVHLAGSETITGNKTFSGVLSTTASSFIGAVMHFSQSASYFPSSGYTSLLGISSGLKLGFGGANTSSLLFPAATQTFTFPNASGTLALTSDLGGYLPLTGGTLTGALSGTSATFSGVITGSRNDAGNISATLANAYLNQGNLLNFQQNNGGSTLNAYIGHGGDNTGNFIIVNNGITPLTLARSNGAATFSSSVTATKAILGASTATSSVANLEVFGSTQVSTNNGQIRINDAVTTSKTMSLGVDGTNNVGFIQSFQDGVAYRSLILNGLGGNVGIGTSSPGVSLEVNGLIRSVPVYNNTTATLSNLVVSAGGTFERSVASSKRFKENIKEWEESGLNTILKLKPKQFNYNKDYYNYPNKKFLGLIAEEVAEVCSFLADYENEDGSGQVENVRYANIVVPLIKAIQEQQAQIEELKALIAAK